MTRWRIAAAALCLAGPLAAQQPGTTGPPAGPPTMDELATRLKLTPQQRNEIAPLHASFVKETEPMRATARAEMAAAHSARAAAAPADSVAAHENRARAEIERINRRAQTWQTELLTKLTEEQKAEWNRWQEERRQQMRQRMPPRDSQPA